MAKETHGNLILYTPQNQVSNVVLIFGHGYRFASTGTFNLQQHDQMGFYVPEGTEARVVVTAQSLQQNIGQRRPRYGVAANAAVTNYTIRKYRGHFGREESNYIPDANYQAISNALTWNIARVHHTRIKETSMLLGDIYRQLKAINNNYNDFFCLHCRVNAYLKGMFFKKATMNAGQPFQLVTRNNNTVAPPGVGIGIV